MSLSYRAGTLKVYDSGLIREYKLNLIKQAKNICFVGFESHVSAYDFQY
jgi:hypothetical protein